MPRGSKPKTQEKFIEEAIAIHGNEFDYSLVEYHGTHTPACIICREHGPFWITPKAHLQRKQKCPKCSPIVRTFQDFVKKSHKNHGDVFHYSYHLVEWVNVNTPVKIWCNYCQWAFMQRPSEHMRSKGCRKCSNCYRRNHQEFEQEAHLKFDNKFQYLSQYVHCDQKILINCPNHGEFWQTPWIHLHSKAGCPQCSHSGVSIGETEWLDFRGLLNTNQFRQVLTYVAGKRFKFDGFDAQTNTVYEYYGDYWHGNINLPKFARNKMHPECGVTYGELYDRTMARQKILEDNGYTMITIWESDWEKMKKEGVILQTPSSNHSNDANHLVTAGSCSASL